MKIYIANTTKHNHRFFYYTQVKGDRYFVDIPSGGQVQIPQDLTKTQVDYILKQIERYGGRDVSQVTEHTPNYSGLSYHVDQTVSEEEILIGHEAVIENAEVRAIEEVSKAASGLDIITRDGDNIQDKIRGKRRSKVTEVQIVQESADPNVSPDSLINTTFKVTPEGREGKYKVER